MKTLLLLLAFLFCAIYSFAQPDPRLSQKVDNLYSFARLYGYVRYFYPGDEAAKMNYSKFAQYAIPKVENAKNPTELKAILDSLFLPIAPGLDIYEDKKPVSFNISKLKPGIEGLQTITWQHLGDGNANHGLYKDYRTNRNDNPDNNETFGNLMTTLNAEKYKGKNVKLSANVKVDAPFMRGNGHLWLRVDLPGKKTGFFNNMDARPITLNEWKHYEITGFVEDAAIDIAFGCFLKGKGKLWVDDIQLTVQNENGQWMALDSLNGDFENGNQDVLPAPWFCPNKYYQAEVTDLTAANGKKSNCISIRDKLFEPANKFGDYVKKSIGNGLSINLPLAVLGDEDHTWPRPDKKQYYNLSGDVNNETPKVFDADRKTDELATAISFWNIFQHFYPYFKVVNVDWDASLRGLLTETYEDKNGIDLLHTLQKYQALLHDGHGHISLKDQKEPGYFPFAWEWIENKLVIADVYDKKIALKNGDIINSINGTDSRKYLDSLMVFTSAATDAYRERQALIHDLAGDTAKLFNIAYTDKYNTRQTTSMFRSADNFKYRHRVSLVNKDTFKKIETGIYYVNMNNISGEGLDECYPQLENAKTIIIDFRGYPKQNFDIIRRLLTVNDTDGRWMRIPQINLPDHEFTSYKYFGWHLKPENPHISAKIILITDSRAISAAESYIRFFDGYKLATIIGEPTAGTNGNVNPLNISGLYTVTWTGMEVVKHDGSQHHGIGIIPSVIVHKTIRGVQEDRDEFLEKALELARK